MTINAENWIGEHTTTTGTGTIVLGGAIRGFARFNVAGDGEIFYVIQDGYMKETGLGTLTGNSLERTTVHATIDALGNYSNQSAPISLSGNAQVFGVLNAEFMKTLYNNYDEVIAAVSDAVAAKTAAEAAKTAAKTSETNAAGSASAASASQTAAAGSATSASTSASGAASSETKAKTSETNAKASETAAGLSQTAAKTSETNAKSSETKAKTSETNAAGSATAADTSKVAAKASEDAAKASQTAAATSQTQAAGSATSAGTAATTATNKANDASASAVDAAASAGKAKTSETNAKASEDAAKGYADILAGSGAWLWKGSIPASTNLNSMGPTSAFVGIWSQSSISATGADIANGYPVAERGVLEIFAGGRNNGTQRYLTDSGRFFERWLSAAWNATTMPWADWVEIGGLSSSTYLPLAVTSLSDATAFANNKTYTLTGLRTDSPVGQTSSQSKAIIMSMRRAGETIMGLYQMMFTSSGSYERFGAPNAATNWTSVSWYAGGDANGWRRVGSDAMAAIDLGLSLSTRISSFDWQQADFLTGSLQTFVFSKSVNPPAGVIYNNNTTVTAHTIQRNSNASVIRLNSLSTANGDSSEYIIVVTGAAGSRSFNVVRSYNSDSLTVIPVANGGTGASTGPVALTNLGGAPLAGPVFTGVPKAPTAAQSDNSTQLATTAYVRAAITALINGAPATMDTLKKLADALGSDPNFATSIATTLAGKQPLDATLTALSGLVNAANQLPYFTGVDTMDVTALTAFMRTMLGKADDAAVRTLLSIGAAGLRNVGESTDDLPGMASFSGVKGESGHKRLPGGDILQWGIIALKSSPFGTTLGTFPRSWPGAGQQIVVTHDNPVTGVLCYGSAQIINATQFRVNGVAIDTNSFTMVGSANMSLRWMAIGS